MFYIQNSKKKDKRNRRYKLTNLNTFIISAERT